MSDKFDKDDFSWQGDDQQGDDDDFPDLDWLADPEDKPSQRDDKRLGVTGELPWLGNAAERTDKQAEEDAADFDWLRSGDDQPSVSDSKRLGVTGQLSWLGGTDDEEAPDNSTRSGVTGQLDWRKANFEEQLVEAERAAGVDWGKEVGDDSTYTADDDEDLEMPEWLRGAAPDDLELEEAVDAPSWLQGTDDTAVSEEDEADTPAWMQGTAFDTSNEDEDQNEARIIEEDEDLVPPAWMVDVPEDINETPSWLTGVTRSAEISEQDLESDDGLSSLFGDDLFAEIETPQQDSDDFDLLAELTSEGGSTGLTDLLNPAAAQPEPVDEMEMDWLRDFEPEASAAVVKQQTELEDVDDFLASLDTGELQIEDTFEDLSGADIEFDDLFTDAGFQPMTPGQSNLPDTPKPDWLSNVSISEVSAAAVVRKQQDRPLEDLSERLQLLREEGLSLSGSTTAPSPSADRAAGDLIPDINDALSLAPVEVGSATGRGIADNLVLTSAQSRNVGILTNLTSASAAAAEALLNAESAPSRRPVRRIRPKLDRLLITVLVAAAVLLPFFGIARIGDLPPTGFAAGSRQQAAFDSVNSLSPGSLVLFAVEYGATGAGELDSYSDALLRHVLIQGARPVLVSSNPVGLLRAENRVNAIGGLVANRDYYLGRYIVGASLGLRSFSEEINALTGIDREGQPTGLNITSLDEFALIVVIVENSEGVRNWSEQVAPLTITPLIFASSYAASPLAVPYNDVMNSGGLLIGFQDAYTYSKLVDNLALGAVPQSIETETRTSEPTETETEAISPEALLTEEAAATEIATTEVSATPVEASTTAATAIEEAAATQLATPTSIITEEAIATEVATESPAPTNTPTEEPTPRPSATPPPTTPASQDVFGVVSAQQAVNVRQGPGTDFPVVGVLQSGERVPVLGANEDQSWYNIRLADGTEGWISAPLIDLEGELPEESPQSSLPVLNLRIVLPVGFGMAFPQIQQVSTQAVTPEIAQTGTPVTAQATEETAVIPNFGSTIPYQDERWYGMTLGIIVIALIIAIGNLLSLLRRQRGR